MSRLHECPKCGHRFRADTMVQSCLDAYEAITVRGMSNTGYAQQNGLHQSTVTLYRRCGTALAVVGVDPDSELFRLLLQGGAFSGYVGAEIERPGATPESVEAALRELKTLQPSSRLGSRGSEW